MDRRSFVVGSAATTVTVATVATGSARAQDAYPPVRIPYAYLYPLIIMLCMIGVYEVNNSIVDVWIMLIMGSVGYLLRKFDFDPAPLVLGLVVTPTFELSLRQSLVMSSGDWWIFFQRPIAATLFAVCVVLLALSAASLVLKQRDWRSTLAEMEAGER